MTLIVEDGTGVTNANSYASVASFQTYAQARSWTIPVSSSDCEVLLVKAMDYLQCVRYVGDLKSPTQLIAWPRTETNWCGTVSAIPFSPNLAIAQMVLANIAQTTNLLPSVAAGASGPVISKAVYGAVSVTYGLPQTSGLRPYLPQIDFLLLGLLASGGQCVAIRS